MGEWNQEQQQYQQPQTPLVVPDLVAELMRQVGAVQADFILGNIEHGKYAEQLADIDEKLRVFGVMLTSRPWEQTGTPNRGF